MAWRYKEKAALAILLTIVVFLQMAMVRGDTVPDGIVTVALLVFGVASMIFVLADPTS
jgi:multisubunit Na+/H+ antiporter MnhF subunit